ncbi:MAG TPA: hypothetical protein VGK22_17510 [Candidatus Angelobacter sp.]|jgi:hypothetical protein
MIAYEKRLLTYLDILGFSDLIDESLKGDPKVVDKIARILQIFSTAFTDGGRMTIGENNNPKELSNFYNFSDLMLRAMLIKPMDDPMVFLDFEVYNLAHRQLLMLIEEQVIIRGAITLDYAVCENNLVFGPAVIQAYLLERDVAIFPRIIVDIRLFEQYAKARPGAKISSHYMKLGEDGVPFIDYLLSVFFDMYRGHTNSSSFPQRILEQHKAVILKKLEELDGKDMKRKAKVWWLWMYHNKTIELIQERLGDDMPMKGAVGACKII